MVRTFQSTRGGGGQSHTLAGTFCAHPLQGMHATCRLTHRPVRRRAAERPWGSVGFVAYIVHIPCLHPRFGISPRQGGTWIELPRGALTYGNM